MTRWRSGYPARYLWVAKPNCGGLPNCGRVPPPMATARRCWSPVRLASGSRGSAPRSLVARGRSAGRVLRGSCDEFGAEARPFAALADMVGEIESALREFLPEEFNRPPWEALDVLRSPAAPAHSSSKPGSIAHLTLDLFRRMAGHRPLLVLLDDLHWADESTCLPVQHARPGPGELTCALDRRLPGGRNASRTPAETLSGRGAPQGNARNDGIGSLCSFRGPGARPDSRPGRQPVESRRDHRPLWRERIPARGIARDSRRARCPGASRISCLRDWTR